MNGQMATLDALRYPVGKWVRPLELDSLEISFGLANLKAFPSKLRAASESLNNEQLDTTYREGGWTIRQVVHHCADSHMNAYVRFKLALTEDVPTIKPYFEDRWAELEDSRCMPIEVSLDLISGLHDRWVYMMESLTDQQWHRGFFHPEQGRELKLFEVLSLYSWHSQHHLAHITVLKGRMDW